MSCVRSGLEFLRVPVGVSRRVVLEIPLAQKMQPRSRKRRNKFAPLTYRAFSDAERTSQFPLVFEIRYRIGLFQHVEKLTTC